MTINNNTISYTAEEWAFIESLPVQTQRYIRMGICTIHECGYKKFQVSSGVTLDEE